MNGRVELLSPIGVVRKREHPLAGRPSSLEGKVVGFLDNHKFSVEEFFARLEPGLRAQVRLAEVVRRRKPSTSEPAPFLDDLAERCDVVVTALAD
jgi:hypothetical protein